MIEKKEPMLCLWDKVKSLKDAIPIYKEAMTEDEDSTPDSYLLLRVVSENTLLFGSGKSQIKRADCEIALVSKGYAANSTDLHNQNKKLVEAALKDEAFNSINLGYDDELKSTQHTYTLSINYLI